MNVITTFNSDGYDLYGKKMITTWSQYWPSNYNLTVYTENFKLNEKDKRIKEININEACPNLEIFKEKSKNIKTKNNKEKRHIAKAIRWSHKVYAISHALENTNNYLIFLDGDTYTKKYVDPLIAEKLVQNHLYAVHFEHVKGMLHFETGLICFNLNHIQMPKLKQELQIGYDNLEIYTLPKAWDGFWFAHLYQKYNFDVFNLGYGVFSNPLIKDVLHHDVGKDKFNKSSIEYDKYSGRKKQ